jgi:hypothetical protein
MDYSYTSVNHLENICNVCGGAPYIHEFPVEDLGGILCLLLLKGGTEIMPTYGCKEPSHSYSS